MKEERGGKGKVKEKGGEEEGGEKNGGKREESG